MRLFKYLEPAMLLFFAVLSCVVAFSSHAIYPAFLAYSVTALSLIVGAACLTYSIKSIASRLCVGIDQDPSALIGSQR